MSQGKMLGPTTAAGAAAVTLPVTGNSVATMALVGVCLLIGGALLIRASRQRGQQA